MSEPCSNKYTLIHVYEVEHSDISCIPSLYIANILDGL
jgi:hypothetical protein